LIKKARRVRSVQRMPLPPDWDAAQIVREYAKWLQRISLGIIRYRFDEEESLSLFLFVEKLLLLRFEPTPYSRKLLRRRAYYITDGLLAEPADPPGRFEVRIFPENHCLVSAIHGFAPRLPWWLYAQTQARLHLAIMMLFKRYLRKIRNSMGKS